MLLNIALIKLCTTDASVMAIICLEKGRKVDIHTFAISLKAMESTLIHNRMRIHGPIYNSLRLLYWLELSLGMKEVLLERILTRTL